MSFSIDGLVSGFDTSSIIESLLGFQETQVETFNTRKAEIASEQTSFKGIEAQILTVQSSLSRLNRTTDSIFSARTATSSNEDILTVSAENGANIGRFNLTVDSLAAAHQIASQGVSSTSDQIANGEVTFQVGNRTAQTLTIESGNNTLAGFANAINEQVDDVSASVIYDQGSDAYRLLLTSNHTGAENELSVSFNTSGDGFIPDFSGPAVQEASDAVVKLGSGPGAISAQFSSNQIDGLIEDVTIDLLSADPDKTIRIDINNDVELAQEAVTGFVTDFNAMIDYIDSQTSFIAETNEASPLLGDRNVANIKNRVLSIVSETIATGTDLKRLAQIGVDLNDKGKLELDSGKLEDALNGRIDGIKPNDIRGLFGLNASSTNSGVEFIVGGSRSLDSSTPYEVNITQAAEQATVTGGTAIASSIDIDSSNNTFQITLDGLESGELTLQEGTYTDIELADHINDVINQSTALGNRGVFVALDDSNNISITSQSFGEKSTISDITGTAATLLGFDGTETAEGKDVAGSFIVNGIEEIAKGTGRVLIGDSENENTADLQFRITLTTEQLVDGPEAEILVSRGVTGRLSQYFDGILSVENGLIKSVNEQFEGRIESIDASIARVESITESKRESLIEEFTRLETILSELQTTGSFISSQLATIQPPSSNN